MKVRMKKFREVLALCADVFENIPQTLKADQVIDWARTTFPHNTDIQQVRMKAVLIDKLYSTMIYNIISVADNIYGHKYIDCKIKEGNATVIEDIRRGHGVRRANAKVDTDLYSFATKYAAWHNHRAFPIFDNLVKDLIMDLNGKYRFHEPSFKVSELRDYLFYKSVIDSLMKETGLGEDFKYKKVDQGLWVFAKFKYKAAQLEPKIIEQIKQAVHEANM